MTQELELRLEHEIAGASSFEELESVKRSWLGKEGIIKLELKKISTFTGSERAQFASKINLLRDIAEQLFSERLSALKNELTESQLTKDTIDPTLPGEFLGIGSIHPLTRVERRILELLKPFGFRVETGPEVETEYYCFDSLNIPPHHPARDMQDTFYTADGRVLRTHTTSIQARVLATRELPLKVATFGRVYRNEKEDASHTAMFHQFDVIWVEEGITLANLQAVMRHVTHGLYGQTRKIRFKPKFYPYTEPSIGLDIDCAICTGSGCPACGDAGWVTVVGAGMVHKNVLQEFGYNTDRVTGFAFGFGSSRLASQQFNLPRGKMLYESDLRVLRTL